MAMALLLSPILSLVVTILWTALPVNGAGSWVTIVAPTAGYLWNPKLLTDGTVLMSDDSDTYTSLRIGPDSYGSYTNSLNIVSTAPYPDGYGPLYCASAVLPDGKVVFSGGEYNYGNASLGRQGT